MFKDKKVLVTGSEGMIGKELVIQLEELGAEVFKFDFKRHFDYLYDSCSECGKDYGKMPLDVRNYDLADMIFGLFKPDYVFHLFGIKGNPKMTKEKPVNFMEPMLRGDTNIISLAQKHKVKNLLYTSSIAVENPETDKYPAWAKMTGETLIEAMRIQYPKGTQYCIVRPSNVYGRFDNIDNPNAMVVTSLINKAIKDKGIVLDNKGSRQYRDFINAKDVARGMIQAMEEMPGIPVNLCSGEINSINIVALEIKNSIKCKIEYKDLNMVLGPQSKPMNINWNFKPKISLRDGIKEVIAWMNGNQA